MEKGFTEEDGRQFRKTLHKILTDPDNNYIFEDMGDEVMHKRRIRLYRGQPHTDHGERGKTLVSGLTMRDVGDCIAREFAQSRAPDAVIQNAMCNIEKMMGIYPNLPGREK